MFMDSTTTRRYLGLGVLSAIASLFVLPISGLVSMYSAYRLHDEVSRLYSYLIGGVGAFSVALWAVYLLTL
jgi:hypothetical protein